jgi:acyl phosphate:glycerol-3-phosphate acyltransferase
VRVLGLVVVYLIGSIPVGFLITRIAGGFDIRGKGSGTIGATNVLRTLGPVPAIATLLGDILKGYVAVRAAEVLGPEPLWGAAGAVLAIVGNCWPVFLRFKGGKGVATGLGAFLALAPKAILPAVAAWLILALAFRYVSLASMVGCGVMAAGVWLLAYPRVYGAAAACAAALIVWRHQANLKRLMSGTEPRLGQRAPAA